MAKKKKRKSSTATGFSLFQQEFKAGLAPGEKFDNKKCAEAWKVKNAVVVPDEKVKQKSGDSGRNPARDVGRSSPSAPALAVVVVEPQADAVSMLQDSSGAASQGEAGAASAAAQPGATAQATVVPSSSVPPSLMDPAERIRQYQHLAEAVHLSIANVLGLITEGRVSIEDKQLVRLNECGAHILQKYDKNGQILQYSPEIAYILTLADIGTQVYADFKRQALKEELAKKAEEPKTQAESAPPEAAATDGGSS